MEVHIEYCIIWNYKPEFDRVSKIIKTIKSNATIYSNKKYPRTGSFEIIVDGTLKYSKLKTKTFPTKEDVKRILID